MSFAWLRPTIVTRMVVVLFAALFSIGCSDPDNPVGPAEPEFVTRVYDGPKWPEDLVEDPLIHTVSYLGFNGPEGRTFPCVGTAAEAESLVAHAGYTSEDLREEDLYFEFDNGRGQLRIFRSTYIESLTFDGGGIGTIGPIRHSPVTPEVVRDLVDRLWVYRNLRLYGAVLLSRQGECRDDTIVLTTHEALIIGGDYGICDRIRQFVTMYRVAKDTGEVEITRFDLPDVGGRCPYGGTSW